MNAHEQFRPEGPAGHILGREASPIRYRPFEPGLGYDAFACHRFKSLCVTRSNTILECYSLRI
jgi:hypothetical protein